MQGENKHTTQYNMLSFDRLFISVPFNRTAQTNPNPNYFVYNPSTKTYTYNSLLPKKKGSKLVITIQEHIVTFDFTSTILNKRMVELISNDNIRDCITNIRERNILCFDVDYVLQNATVIAADVTKDVAIDSSWIDQLSYYTSIHIKNNRKYTIDHYRNRFVLRKLSSVNDNRYKRSLTVYDKYYQLKRNHCPYHEVLDYYRGVWRIERKLRTKKEIREALHFSSHSSVSLADVLNADANPFTELYTKIVNIEPHSIIHSNIKNLRIGLLVDKYEGNMRQIEEELRKMYKSFHRKMLIPYQDYIDNLIDHSATELIKQIIEFFDTSNLPP